ncbi:two-component system response regulator [Halobacteriales archaeon QH_2_65_14]|nr:MAG: two-component system response regulator [Halobacteriales archaeon QH_2_65_14]
MTMSEQSRAGDPADILLVEDNPGDIRLTREAFEENRIANTLHVVTDGVEALDFLLQRGEYADAQRPDIILLDLNLPRKNGDEVLEEMDKEDPDLSRVPVIVLTSSQAEEDIVRSYELNANAYLTKPVDPTEFIETVQRFKAFWLEVVRLPPEET